MTQQDFEITQRELYAKLLRTKYDGKAIWERINDKELACAPAFEGDKYNKSKMKLMYVGRALNGWEHDFKANSVEELTDLILGQKSSLDDLINKDGFGNGKRKYRHKNTNYWRLLKFLLDEGGDSNGTEWYQDAEDTHWNQKIVWSNLYKIAPYHTGNPSFNMIKPDIETYVEIIKAELDYYNPRCVLFVTNNDFFIPWKNKVSFKDIMTEKYTPVEDNPYIAGITKYNNTKVIVSKRPDFRGATINFVQDMAKVIYKTFTDL